MEEISFHIEDNAGNVPGFKLSAILPLPYAVSTAAWLLPMGDELRILINTGNAAVHLAVSKKKEITIMLPIDRVIAGAAADDKQLLVTTNLPSVAAINRQGIKEWEYDIKTEDPLIWPRPFINKKMQLAWQVQNGLLEISEPGFDGLHNHRRYTVGETPLFFASEKEKLYCVWKKADDIEGIEITGDVARSFKTTVGTASQVLLTAENNSLLIALQHHDSVELVRFTHTDMPASRTVVKLPAGVTEIASVIAAGKETVFLLKKKSEGWQENELQIQHVLFADGYNTIIVNGFIHAITYWNGQLVLLGTSMLYLVNLKKD